jgi:hypothetical protein
MQLRKTLNCYSFQDQGSLPWHCPCVPNLVGQVNKGYTAIISFSIPPSMDMVGTLV